MTLEQRLAEALHSLDDYQPSIDLYARTSRGIEEDRRHRRRLISAAAGAVVGVILVSILMLSVVETVDGRLVAPIWAILLARTGVMVTLLVVLGPVIRRFGQPFIRGAFNLDPEAGVHFSRVLDIAYYLVFGGLTVLTLGINIEGSVAIPHDLKDPHLDALAIFVLLMGIGHALNLVAIPVVGLIHGATWRRVARHNAGESAPTESVGARQADRVAKWIVAIVGILLVWQVIGFVIAIVFGILG